MIEGQKEPQNGNGGAAPPQGITVETLPEGTLLKGKVGNFLNLPAEVLVGEKQVIIKITKTEGEKGGVHWLWVLGAGVGGIGLGVGLTFAGQALFGGDDAEVKPKAK